MSSGLPCIHPYVVCHIYRFLQLPLRLDCTWTCFFQQPCIQASACMFSFLSQPIDPGILQSTPYPCSGTLLSTNREATNRAGVTTEAIVKGGKLQGGGKYSTLGEEAACWYSGSKNPPGAMGEDFYCTTVPSEDIWKKSEPVPNHLPTTQLREPVAWAQGSDWTGCPAAIWPGMSLARSLAM